MHEKAGLAKGMFVDGLSTDQVLLDDLLDHFRGAPAVPDAIRHDRHDRSSLADPHTAGFLPDHTTAFG